MKIIALAAYQKQVKRLLSSEERMAMEAAIAADPAAYPVMGETGGCRKARRARGNRGKSAGIRSIFYYFVSGETVYMIDAYPKNEKENLSNAEKNSLKKLAAEIERNAKSKTE
jgi:hypothetical protein